MKALLVAINSKYIHTNLAVRSIAAWLEARDGLSVPILELTVNQRHGELLRTLALADTDCYLFSCYIWNIEVVKALLPDLKALRPCAAIVLGGPEADWQAAELLQAFPQADCVLCGEGEATAGSLLRALEAGMDLAACPGLAFRRDGDVRFTDPAPDLQLGDLPFPYPDLASLNGRIPYYETMRGCPFSCSYCLSARDRAVRLRPLDLVFRDLTRFLDAAVPQVKLVDRTFNCDPRRALKIWRFLADHDNGSTNFHFELAGHLLDEETLAFLASVRPGLFQFEIGVQSTNPATLKAIDRSGDIEVLFGKVDALREPGNIHIHLDLIAGLPEEGFHRFAASFDHVYRLRPHQLQLGFLKLLGGSAIRREAAANGTAFQSRAPYEVLFTRWLTYEELCILHGVDEMVDAFYNSGRFRHVLDVIVEAFPSPFACFRLLWEFYETRQQGAPLSKVGYYDLLGEFMASQGIPITERIQWLGKYDLLLHEKPRKLPNWVTVDLSGLHREALSPLRKQIDKTSYLELFPFLPPDGPEELVLLSFDYGRRDITGRALVSRLPFPPQ